MIQSKQDLLDHKRALILLQSLLKETKRESPESDTEAVRGAIKLLESDILDYETDDSASVRW